MVFVSSDPEIPAFNQIYYTADPVAADVSPSITLMTKISNQFRFQSKSFAVRRPFDDRRAHHGPIKRRSRCDSQLHRSERRWAFFFVCRVLINLIYFLPSSVGAEDAVDIAQANGSITLSLSNEVDWSSTEGGNMLIIIIEVISSLIESNDVAIFYSFQFDLGEPYFFLPFLRKKVVKRWVDE